MPKVVDLQNDDEDEDTYRQMVEEAFAADDVVADFEWVNLSNWLSLGLPWPHS